MDLTAPVTTISGIGPIVAKKLENLSIYTVYDFLYHLPFRYEDRSLVSPISHLQPGETVTIIGQIETIKNEFTRKGKNLQKATITDDSGSISVIWFNQTFLTRTLKTGMTVSLYGKVDLFGSKKTLISPEYEIATNRNYLLHTARIVPIYPETAGVSSKWFRTKIFPLLNQISTSEILPESIFQNPQVPQLSWLDALKSVHFPQQESHVAPARHRLAFDELLVLQLASLYRKETWNKTKLAHQLKVDPEKVVQFISQLPFTLTLSQNQAIQEILEDLGSTKPMNRLLEGDVGSGKTVVAAVAALVASLNGLQTIFLAPTQILAQQHYSTLTALFKSLNLPISLVTATNRKSDITSPILVGTHALLFRQYPAERVGLIIIDEQHRFGVAQRAMAVNMGTSPHILTMTATPIPRTIALTLHGDLDLSLLKDPPSGRLKVKTWVVPEPKRDSAYKWIDTQLTANKTQAFIVCPFIEESESLSTVKAATTEYERLKSIFPHHRLGLLHGKLKPKDKDEVINKFRAGDYSILVSTPVVEVGIDIPNATIMVIEAADRFGLAQLHQLRGRVGRSHQQSYCLLFADTDTARLKAMETHFSGLELAEIDLKLRGPGQIYGTAQHGLTQFKVAGYQDLDLFETARQVAPTVLPHLSESPQLRQLVDQGKIDLVQPN